MSKKDYGQIERNLTASAKKKFRYLTTKRIATAVALDMLAFGPNQSLEKVISPGWAIVDVVAIKNESDIENFKEELENKTP